MSASQMHSDGQQIQSDEDALQSSYTQTSLWLAKIEHAKKLEKDWRKLAREATNAYDSGEDKDSLFNIFHSNIETLVPALYNSTPVPDVRRRYAEKDRASRLAAELVERLLVLQMDRYNFDGVMRAVVHSAVVPGRGVARIRYEGELDITVELVPWDRFIMGPGLVWSDVSWVAYEHDMTEDDLRDKIGLDQERIEQLGFGHCAEDNADEGKKEEHKGVYKFVRVFEIWDKRSRSVVWVTDRDDDDAEPLLVAEDPYGFKNFFDIPEPLQQIKPAGSLIPRCQYKIYKPLLEELEDVSSRIQGLVKQAVVKGISDPRLGSAMAILETAADGEYVTAQNAESFTINGNKLNDLLSHWPLEPIMQALSQLYVQRDQIKQQIYEVTGISDIMRGQVDSREKLGQSQIKAQSMSLKLSEQQKEVQRFARDLLRMKAELAFNVIEFDQIAEETLMDFSDDPTGEQQQQDMPPEQIQAMAFRTRQQVAQILQPGVRSLRIDIETDSTIRADLSRNQEQFQQMLTGSGQFIQAIATAQQVMPERVPGFMAVFQAYLRQFNLPKSAEDALEQLAEQPKQKQEDPRLMEAMQAIEQLHQELQSRDAEVEKHQMTLDSNQRIKQMEIDAKLRIEGQKLENERQDYIRQIGVDAEASKREDDRLDLDIEAKARELELRKREIELKELEFELKAASEDTKAKQSQAELEEKRRDRRSRSRQAKKDKQQAERNAA